MKEYNREDFVTYYRNSYVRNPLVPNSVAQLLWDGDRGIALYAGNRELLTNQLLRELPIFDYTLLDWEHVRRPRLGYRHLEGGKYLFRASLNRANQRAKGIHEQCVEIAVPREFSTTVQSLGVKYNVERTLNISEAQELCFPNFVQSGREAVQRLMQEENAIGFALDEDTAMVLGHSAKEAFLLLFKGSKIAVSPDGHTWEFNDKDLEGVVSRHVKY